MAYSEISLTQLADLVRVLRIPTPILSAVDFALAGGVSPEAILERVRSVAGDSEKGLAGDVAAYLRNCPPFQGKLQKDLRGQGTPGGSFD